ncbi:MAG: hypothetical protein K6E11_00100 [Bacilli bacterium]|nr:hypothetical protein [Bacilli bacterium]
MWKQLSKILLPVLVLLLLCTGIFIKIIDFSLWLFALKNSSPDISMAGAITARALAFITSYSLVGIIFDIFGLWNKRLMSIAYIVFSTLLGFLVAYLIWVIETHIVVLMIIMGVAVVLVVIYFLVTKLIQKKKPESTKQ